jgi:hypothetical protein
MGNWARDETDFVNLKIDDLQAFVGRKKRELNSL